MPSWKKVIVSGSDASLSSLNVATSITASIISASSGITGSLFGTASWAQNALTSSFITSTGTNAFVQNGNSFGATALLGTNDTQNLQFETNGSVRMTISSSGNVGIGTTAPSASLHISGASNQSLLQVSSPSATNALFISGSGNVGIGTTTPTSRLHIGPLTGGDGTAQERLRLTGDWTSVGSGALLRFTNQHDSGTNPNTGEYNLAGIAGVDDNANWGGSLYFYTSPTGTAGGANLNTRMIINASGNVGIGTTSPSVRLHISGTSATNELVYLTGDASQGSAIRFNRGSSYSWRMGVTNASNFTIEDTSYSTTRFQISNTSGLVGINTTSPNARLHISGANNEALLRLQSPTSASILFVSGSGNVGIGTLNPRVRLQINEESLVQLPTLGTSTGGMIIAEPSALYGLSVGVAGSGNTWFQSQRFDSSTTTYNILLNPSGGSVGIGLTTSPTSRLQVRGEGATSATTALRVENSAATARLTILDDGTSAFNTSHLYVSSSGNVGIGTTTPSASLHIEGNLQISTGSLYTYGQNTDIDSGSIRTVMSVATGSYRAAFFDYVLNKSTNARAGTVFSVWNGTSVEWNDVSTNDIGNTTEVNLSVGLSGANVILYASSSTNDWSVKALARMI